MQFLENTKILCLTYDEFVTINEDEPKVMQEATYKWNKREGNIIVHGRGGNGRRVLIEYETLPVKYKQIVKGIYGDPYEYHASTPLLKMVATDVNARLFFAEYVLPTGMHLEAKYQERYSRQSDWLNMMNTTLQDKQAIKEVLQISMDQWWKNVIKLHQNDKPVNPYLPKTQAGLAKKLKQYSELGYGGLVDTARFGNNNARKVNDKIERLILSLYRRREKPYLKEVCEDYTLFMNGELQIVDYETAEVFDPQDFFVKGIPYKVGESTVDYYIKKPGNQAIVDKGRMSDLEYNTIHRPSVKRVAPMYAFSKITMDDIDIPFKTPEGGRDVKSYQIFDVASGAVIGVSFSRDKNKELVKDAMRDMLRLIMRNGWGLPLQIEAEKHLNWSMRGKVNEETGEFEADLLTEGNIFPFVRICKGGNAKEKRAEHLIRVKKYGLQKKRPGFQARHYARLLTNRLNKDQDKVRYEYERIVENELNDIEAHNHELHPRQDKYPGLTRWQVLEQYQNPNSIKYPLQTIIQYIGIGTETSYRGGYVQVQYNQYRLPDINIVKELLYNSTLVAYWIPDEEGNINSVYLFQDGNYVCEATKVVGYQEAMAERTSEDWKNAHEQWDYQKGFDEMARKGRSELVPVEVIATPVNGAIKLPAAPEHRAMLPEPKPEPMAKMQQKTPKKGGYMQKKGGKTQANDLSEDAESRAWSDI